MDFTGRYVIPAPPAAVWSALFDPEVLAACIPGCESVLRTGANEYQAKVMLKVGPLKARFEGKVALEEQAPPEGHSHAALLKGQGQGGPAGFAKGEADVRLAPDGEGTVLTYEARANVGGKLAQIGQRLIDGAAKSLADEFFAKFAASLQSTPQAAQPNEDAGAPEGENMAQPPAPLSMPGEEEGLGPQIWVAGLIGIIIILLIVFGIVL